MQTNGGVERKGSWYRVAQEDHGCKMIINVPASLKEVRQAVWRIRRGEPQFDQFRFVVGNSGTPLDRLVTADHFQGNRI